MSGEREQETWARMFRNGWRIVLDPLTRDDGCTTWDAWLVASTGERIYESPTFESPADAMKMALEDAAKKFHLMGPEEIP